ncbi:MAG TPA: family 20 glycosylhydrolase, partial [Usitatibacter sp.]|nr:family 20 glycosylhydrolase [Usitatibacter sp.]
MRIVAVLAATCCIASLPAAGDDALAVIPAPLKVVRASGSFELTPATPIVAGGRAAGGVAPVLADYVARGTGIRLAIRDGAPRDGAINLRIDPTVAGAEAYRLEVAPARVTLTASTREGLVHAATTLWQLIAVATADRVEIGATTIEDAPQFAWRGMMLDSARHFQEPAFILRFIDAMAMHKLNVLHWHLTDDQAWRIEIRKYPKLTQVGAWRVPAGAARNDIDPA